ncbi:MAG: HutD family protein [Bacillota bacterium]|nr:HutD family protein [Bacillota bacterium]
MSMDIEVIRKKQYKTSEWSGGRTTELYIYPKDSLYCSRNFKWRLSSAKVEVERSTFTSLPGINRLIMVIKGELFLEHEGNHNTFLKEFQQDSFSGDWTTTSRGRVTDFNLMMAQGCNGKLEAISLNRGESKDILLLNNLQAEEFSKSTEAFYIVKGNVEIDTGAKEKINLSDGDLTLVNKINKEDKSVIKLYNSSGEEAKIIRTSIFY